MADLIQLDVDDTQIRAVLQQLANRATDAQPAMQHIASILLSHTEAAFAAQGDPTKWRDLADSTKAARTKDGTWPGRILQVTGELAASFTPDSGSDYAQVGSNKVQAAIQQLGGMAGRDHKTEIPARPMLPITEDKQLTPDARTDILEFMGDYLSAP